MPFWRIISPENYGILLRITSLSHISVSHDYFRKMASFENHTEIQQSNQLFPWNKKNLYQKPIQLLGQQQGYISLSFMIALSDK